MKPVRPYELRYKKTDFEGGDKVTVTMSNGCQARGTVVETSMAKIDTETREILYEVRIQSGPLRGVVYYANESQLKHGWLPTPETCEGEGSTVSETNSEGVSSATASATLLLVAAGLVALYAWNKQKNNTAHA